MTQGSYLAKERTNVVVRVERQTKFSIPIHTLDSIICFGNIGCSPFLMGHCGKNNVSISFHTENGKFLARCIGPQSGNVLLRRAQNVKTRSIAHIQDFSKNIITAKIRNCRNVIQRGRRDHEKQLNTTKLFVAEKRLLEISKKVMKTSSLDEIRGHEGEAAQTYFQVFNELILSNKDTFIFTERNRRPPKDPVNAILSFLYTLLANDCRSACESIGLDPQMGFLHADRPGRSSLALDIMEELRPLLADRVALTLINRNQLSTKGFQQEATGGVLMDEKTRKKVIVAYQKRKDDEIFHSFLDEKITIGLLPFIQARLVARWIRDDLDAYPPFFWR